MNRTLLLLVAALAAAAVLVPTGAVPFEATGADTIEDDLVVRPADGPNGDYAILNGDDEIELLLTGANPYVDGEGINPDAVTPIPRVFTMTYTGDGAAEVWLTDDAADVRFFHGDDPDDSLEGRANSVVLAGGQQVAVGVRIDTRGEHDVEQAETFTIHAEGPDDGSSGGSNSVDSFVEPDDGTETPTATDTATETSTPTPNETEQQTEPSAAGGDTETTAERRVESATATPTTAPTATDTDTEAETETASTSTTAADEPTELGGLGLGQLAIVGGGLVVLLFGLAGFRLGQ
ncbi:hypothetical protein [Haloarcula litorea]|uniref:hypothetical protein n=1 Tax=Haloarcula litorea TaxID=3032579 RepID=UPI0023E86ADD|nr:hypothetical protein [Halomicroarcula sp. GDY20]